MRPLQICCFLFVATAVVTTQQMVVAQDPYWLGTDDGTGELEFKTKIPAQLQKEIDDAINNKQMDVVPVKDKNGRGFMKYSLQVYDYPPANKGRWFYAEKGGNRTKLPTYYRTTDPGNDVYDKLSKMSGSGINTYKPLNVVLVKSANQPAYKFVPSAPVSQKDGYWLGTDVGNGQLEFKTKIPAQLQKEIDDAINNKQMDVVPVKDKNGRDFMKYSLQVYDYPPANKGRWFYAEKGGNRTKLPTYYRTTDPGNDVYDKLSKMSGSGINSHKPLKVILVKSAAAPAFKFVPTAPATPVASKHLWMGKLVRSTSGTTVSFEQKVPEYFVKWMDELKSSAATTSIDGTNYQLHQLHVHWDTGGSSPATDGQLKIVEVGGKPLNNVWKFKAKADWDNDFRTALTALAGPERAAGGTWVHAYVPIIETKSNAKPGLTVSAPHPVLKFNLRAYATQKKTGPFDPTYHDYAWQASSGPNEVHGGMASLPPGIVASVNSDGSIDVAWGNISKSTTTSLDHDHTGLSTTRNGWFTEGRNWASNQVFIHRIDKGLTKATPVSGLYVPGGKGMLVGFVKDGDNTAYVLVSSAQYHNGDISDANAKTMIAPGDGRLGLHRLEYTSGKYVSKGYFRFNKSDLVGKGAVDIDNGNKWNRQLNYWPYGITNAGTGRLAIATLNGKKRVIGFFSRRAYGDPTKPADKVMHQGTGYFVLNADGTPEYKLDHDSIGHSWDQRAIWDGKEFVLLHNAENYPFVAQRVPFSKPKDGYLAEKQKVLDWPKGQDTYVHLGGLVAGATAGTSVYSYSKAAITSFEAPHDVYINSFTKSSVGTPTKITTLANGTTAMCVKLAKSGNTYVVLWEQWKKDGDNDWHFDQTYAAKVTSAMQLSGQPQSLGNIRLSRQDDIFTGSNYVGWITGDFANGRLILNRLDATKSPMVVDQKAFAVSSS